MAITMRGGGTLRSRGPGLRGGRTTAEEGRHRAHPVMTAAATIHAILGMQISTVLMAGSGRRIGSRGRTETFAVIVRQIGGDVIVPGCHCYMQSSSELVLSYWDRNIVLIKNI